jgi:hypothetical protein
MQLEKAGTESEISLNFLFVLAMQFHSRDATLCFTFPKFHTEDTGSSMGGGGGVEIFKTPQTIVNRRNNTNKIRTLDPQ